MKFLLSFAVLAVLSVIVEASSHHEGIHHGAARHNRLARRAGTNGRCKVKKDAPSGGQPAKAAPSPSQSGNNDGNKDKSVAGNVVSEVGNAVSGLINVKSDSGQCGKVGAVKDISSKAGPNGALDWLTCGLNDKGWQPPYVTIDDIVSVDLNEAIKSKDSPFKPCSSYIWAFEQYGKQFGVPPIVLASFAMQESTCNPNTVGGAGEQGLMQLTKDKCTKAPGGNCKDVNYNVQTGAQYFSDNLKKNNGDLLLTIGEYNGWHRGMTYGEATSQRWSCCRCQNNLDYLHQFLNGWIQNYDAYTHGLGVYFNLNVCGGSG